ncbi:hypothetical protein AYO38_02915 [bacterium SCGC AG-212-C10]|nr:hypothetical protein AYO38_02915 [bacterium SCGC AG-212-C10]
MAEEVTEDTGGSSGEQVKPVVDIVRSLLPIVHDEAVVAVVAKEVHTVLANGECVEHGPGCDLA